MRYYDSTDGGGTPVTPVTQQSNIDLSQADAAQRALTKLTGGQPLTAEEKTLLDIKPTGNEGKTDNTATKTIVDTKDNGDGTYTVIYSDKTTEVKGKKVGGGTPASNTVTAATADTTAYDNRVSAYNLLKQEFEQYGLGSLVDGIKGLIQENIPASEFSLRLQNTPEYQKRFSANADRIKNGLGALTPAQYIALEDQYQNVMRNYGLPASYYTLDSTGKQQGFDKLLANDVSAAELENRVQQAKDRVLNSNPEVLQALKQYYPGITNGDVLAYTLDPKNALKDIQQKISAAEIGGAALAQGLTASQTTAENLAAAGINKQQAAQGYVDVSQMVPRGSELAAIYGESPYGQSQAEAEVFGTAGAAEAKKKRQKLTDLERAQFGGSSGVGALSRDRATNYGTTQSGYGAY